MQKKEFTPRELAVTAAEVCWKRKADDINVIEVGAIADMASYFVICTAANDRLANSVIDDVRRTIRKDFGVHELSIEGDGKDIWAIIDYGDVVVHVFSPESRELYRLDKLWEAAPVLELTFDDEAEDHA